MNDYLEYLGEETFKQHVENMVRFPLTTYSKIQDERDNLKELLSKRNQK